jgi:hydrogenase nickel incorporation protein HypA/HybF
MHELSIAMSILEMAQEESEKHGGTTAEALASAYELAREQTPFENCRLVIETIPIAIYCAKCQAERSVQSLQWFCCAECGTPSTEVLRGRELQVSALELAS